MTTILILGSSDRATAAALRLSRAGFNVILSEEEKPLDIYYNRTFTRVLYSGYHEIEGIPARTMAHALESGLIDESMSAEEYITFTIANREIPVIVEPDATAFHKTAIDYVIVTNEVLYHRIKSAVSFSGKVIGFDDGTCPVDYKISASGSFAGRVQYSFLERAGENTAQRSETRRRFSRVHLPLEGVFIALKKINEQVHEKEPIAKLNDIPILAPESGRLVGLLNSGIIIPAGTDFAEIAPLHTGARGDVIPQREWSIAGGILETVMYDMHLEAGK